MLTYQDILQYHLSSKKFQSVGFELEIFVCTSLKGNVKRHYWGDNNSLLKEIFSYLIESEKFSLAIGTKSRRLEKDGMAFSLEPGSQLEFSSKPSTLDKTLAQYDYLLTILKKIEKKFGCKFLFTGYSPSEARVKGLETEIERYKVMDAYFGQIGGLGRQMMRDTASLQICLDFKSKTDLEKKVFRLLLAEPILFLLAANSRTKTKGLPPNRSYRRAIWERTDAQRCGPPGSSPFVGDEWHIEQYIEQICKISTLYDFQKRHYTSTEKPFANFMSGADIDDYTLHLSTTFHDIRIKNYIEIRYLDNPGLVKVKGLIVLTSMLVYNEDIWQTFLENLPYTYSQVPQVLDELNKDEKISREIFGKYLDKFFERVRRPLTKYWVYIAPLMDIKDDTNHL